MGGVRQLRLRPGTAVSLKLAPFDVQVFDSSVDPVLPEETRGYWTELWEDFRESSSPGAAAWLLAALLAGGLMLRNTVSSTAPPPQIISAEELRRRRLAV